MAYFSNMDLNRITDNEENSFGCTGYDQITGKCEDTGEACDGCYTQCLAQEL